MPLESDESDLVTVAESARITNRCRQTVDGWVHRHLIETVCWVPDPHGGRYMRMFRRADVLALAAKIDGRTGRVKGELDDCEPATMAEVEATIERTLREPLPEWWDLDRRLGNPQTVAPIVLYMLARRRCKL
jgi:hypothetical protein